jgi:hypothetical protein
MAMQDQARTAQSPKAENFKAGELPSLNVWILTL